MCFFPAEAKATMKTVFEETIQRIAEKTSKS